MKVNVCNSFGMLLTGVVSPDNKANGIINKNENNIACCMVCDTDETNSPMPTAANKNKIRPVYKLKNEPANGIRNHSSATSSTVEACTIPINIEGSALPIMISTGLKGVTNNLSKVPCSRSRATDIAVSNKVCN